MLRPPETNADTLSQEVAQRTEERRHRPLPRGVPHETDAPRLPGELTEAAADLDAVGVEQRLTQRRVVGAVGEPRGGELRQAVTIGDDEPEPELGQRALESIAHRAGRAHAASSPSSSTAPRAACSANTIATGAVW